MNVCYKLLMQPSWNDYTGCHRRNGPNFGGCSLC